MSTSAFIWKYHELEVLCKFQLEAQKQEKQVTNLLNILFICILNIYMLLYIYLKISLALYNKLPSVCFIAKSLICM